MKKLLVLLGLIQLVFASNLFAFPVDVAEAPDTSLALTLSAIHSAKHSLLINIYELTAPEIIDAIIGQVQAGKSVQLILEGQPTGGMPASSKGVEVEIAQAMRATGLGDHLYEMTSKAGKRRFRFDHAKYIVIDSQDLLIGSENYSPTGNPEPTTPGNRGWEVLIHDVASAQHFMDIFKSDSDMSAGDLIDVVNSSSIPNRLEMASIGDLTSPLNVSNPITYEVESLEFITSPDTSLNGLLNLINEAKTSIDIEQMTFDSQWRGQGGDAMTTRPPPQAVDRSPLLDAVIKAARRGVHVRVLLNDESVYSHSKTARSINPTTVQNLLDAAGKENLPIEAKIANLKAMGVAAIHNKGVLVDGNKTLISSINWGSNSILNNREAAVVLYSNDIYSFYEGFFNQDWKRSGGNSSLKVASFALSQDPAAFKCPDSLHVVADVGTLVLTSPTDSFRSIANHTLQVDLYHAEDVDGCVLVEASKVGETSISKELYLQIRKRSDGSRAIALEGYTPKYQLFSLRTALQKGNSLYGDYSAAVYDGSGPSRKLGEADLMISNER